jgi:hypothetical protein
VIIAPLLTVARGEGAATAAVAWTTGMAVAAGDLVWNTLVMINSKRLWVLGVVVS